MARYVYKTNAQIGGKVQVCEAEIDGNAALFFFF